MTRITSSRRDFLVSAAVAGAATATISDAVASKTSDDLPPIGVADPRASGDGLVKVMATLGREPIWWWVTGIIHAQQGENAPIRLVRFESCEVLRIDRRPDGSHVQRANMLTFFRDNETREWLDYFANPVTGERVKVEPSILRDDGSAGMVYPSDGSVPHFEGDLGKTRTLYNRESLAGASPAKPPAPPKGELNWHVIGDTVLATMRRPIDAGAQPWVEVSTASASQGAFFDPRVQSAPATSIATFLSPWLQWMRMSAQSGHLVWHGASVKLHTIQAVPRDYIAHARTKGLLDLLTPPRT